MGTTTELSTESCILQHLEPDIKALGFKTRLEIDGSMFHNHDILEIYKHGILFGHVSFGGVGEGHEFQNDNRIIMLHDEDTWKYVFQMNMADPNSSFDKVIVAVKNAWKDKLPLIKKVNDFANEVLTSSRVEKLIDHSRVKKALAKDGGIIVYLPDSNITIEVTEFDFRIDLYPKVSEIKINIHKDDNSKKVARKLRDFIKAEKEQLNGS